MRPEDIKRLYASESSATDEESRQTQHEARTDPEQARRLIKVIYAMSTEDRDFAMLLRLFLEGTLMRYIEERATADDTEALLQSNLLVDLMNATMRRVQRGKSRTARSA